MGGIEKIVVIGAGYLAGLSPWATSQGDVTVTPATSRSITVSCGSSGTPSDALLAAIRGLVGEMKVRNLRLYFGASDLGLMGVVLDEAKHVGLWVCGVTCKSLLPVSSVPEDLDDLVVTDTLPERRHKLIAGADYAVFLPGGLGTFDELAGALLPRQLGELTHPPSSTPTTLTTTWSRRSTPCETTATCPPPSTAS